MILTSVGSTSFWTLLVSPPFRYDTPAWYNPTQWGLTQWGMVGGVAIVGYVLGSARKADATPADNAPPGQTSNVPVNPCAPGSVPEIGGGCLHDVFTDSPSAYALPFGRAAEPDDAAESMGDLVAR